MAWIGLAACSFQTVKRESWTTSSVSPRSSGKEFWSQDLSWGACGCTSCLNQRCGSGGGVGASAVAEAVADKTEGTVGGGTTGDAGLAGSTRGPNHPILSNLFIPSAGDLLRKAQAKSVVRE